ncbi:hypothetical protein L3V82_12005 [Thiotrichales bacterium 19S3-7]|nr:hypothetical protein [Thiotrichales bacterium 19S3-7]MCF6802918.1 hypothetical protein [Thiotrichales bacterium 19S3-11]
MGQVKDLRSPSSYYNSLIDKEVSTFFFSNFFTCAGVIIRHVETQNVFAIHLNAGNLSNNNDKAAIKMFLDYFQKEINISLWYICPQDSYTCDPTGYQASFNTLQNFIKSQKTIGYVSAKLISIDMVHFLKLSTNGSAFDDHTKKIFKKIQAEDQHQFITIKVPEVLRESNVISQQNLKLPPQPQTLFTLFKSPAITNKSTLFFNK